MSSDESFIGLLGQDLSDVRPLAVEPRVALVKHSMSEVALRQKRADAVRTEVEEYNRLSGEFIEPVDPHDVLAFKRPGIQNGVYRNLRLGKYAMDARLDLHNLTVEQARLAVHTFVQDCCQHDIRSALITHGKGEGRKPQPAMLKSCIAHWLPQLTEVQAFHSAQKQHGGVGATYVLIRKSDKQRLENAERLHKRR
ncbi:DNA endonuclease SmrA [Simiduia aestuariiviva]|uniref:DNA-nicking Smr family endonuclease n=1 Tax=Simiduia aestuariiviva TaxID=1510459 RepID=A0A839UUA8_9GAMM|nr:DNA endonuclease SmrA [Simiduia aestuariiviva]MBB3169556.1 DNA-nicking Smr family endonuclease [Simiduia aestuariiviva]